MLSTCAPRLGPILAWPLLSCVILRNRCTSLFLLVPHPHQMQRWKHLLNRVVEKQVGSGLPSSLACIKQPGDPPLLEAKLTGQAPASHMGRQRFRGEERVSQKKDWNMVSAATHHRGTSRLLCACVPSNLTWYCLRTPFTISADCLSTLSVTAWATA